MKLFRDVGVVVHVHRRSHTLPEAQQRPGKLPVVNRHRDNAIGRQFNRAGGNGKSIIGFCLSLVRGLHPSEPGVATQQSAARERGRSRQQLPARKIDALHGINYVASRGSL